MPKKYVYHTPAGDFDSLKAAAVALNCDRGTVINRCQTDPDHYHRTEAPPVKRIKIKPVKTTRNQSWPMTWNLYRSLGFEAGEKIWLSWCKEQGLDPELASTVDQFFSEMDAVEQVDEK